MFDIAITRNQFGSNNCRDTETFSDQPVEDWTKYHEWFQDFDEFNSANYTVSNVGSGTAYTLTGVNGGAVQAVTAAVSTDFYSLQLSRGTFVLQAGYRCFGAFLLSVDNTLANIIAGLTSVTAAPFTAANTKDGVWITTAATGAIAVNVGVNGTLTTVANAAIYTAGLTNYIMFKFFWDGGIYQNMYAAGAQPGAVIWELSGSAIATPARGVIAAPTGFPYSGVPLLSPTVGVQASSAAARTQNVDLMYVLNERINPLATPVF